MKNKAAELDKAIARFYEGYAAKRVAAAALLVGVLSLGVALTVYSIFASGLWAAVAGFFVGFIGINVAFLTVVPPASSLNKARNLISEAVKDTTRIKSYNMQEVQLADAKGTVHTLGTRDMNVWKRLVVPYLIERQVQGNPPPQQSSQRKITASERKYIEQRGKEVKEMEKKIEQERNSLEEDRRELEERGADLKQAEELVIARLTGVEQAEAELEQLKIVAAERADVDAVAYDAKIAEAKAAELKVKESELGDLKARLAKDRQEFESQKAELTRLQASAKRTPFAMASNAPGSSAEQSIEAREAALKIRQQQLEEATSDLENRASFVTDSENSLIERLDELSHREATIEQSEIDAGLRKD